MFDPDALMTQAAQGKLGIPPPASTNEGVPTYSAVIDVGGKTNIDPSAAPGHPGSGWQNTGSMPPTPDLDATMVRLRQQSGGGSPDSTQALPQPAITVSPAPFDPDALMTMAAQGKVPPPPPSNSGGVLANFGAGISETTANVLGMPVDAATGAINAGIRGAAALARPINAALGAPAPPDNPAQITNPVGGSDWWKGAQGYIGADPRTVPQGNELDRAARAAGSGAASMVLPWAGVRAIPAMAGIPGALQQAFGAGSAPMMATAGAMGGGAGQYAKEAAPPQYAPLAELAGNIAGGSVPIGIAAALKGGYNAVAPTVSHYLAPFTQAGRQAAAGQRIASAATDLPAVKEALANPPPPLVQGSNPTTYQLTGDQGLGDLERRSAVLAPAQFQGRSAEQNAARVSQVRSLAPVDASPHAVGESFRAQLADMDATHEAQADALKTGARRATAAVGGEVPAGADQQATALQAFGQRIRGGLADINAREKTRVSRLYDAVDPEGKLALDMRDIKAEARAIVKDIPKNDPLEGEASKIFGTTQMQPNTQSFKELAALRGRLTRLMRDEMMAGGRASPAYRAMARLLSSIDATMGRGVEEAATAPGVAERIAAAAREGEGGPIVGTGSGQGAEGVSVGATAQGAGESGTAGGTRLRSGNAGGNSAVATAEAVSGTAGELPGDLSPFERELYEGLAPKALEATKLTPNFTPEAAEAARKANAAHATRIQTFHEAPGVGQVLASGRHPGEWRLGDSQVASTIFNAGKGAAERVRAFLKAGGDSAGLVHDLEDYAAFDLRRAAEDADGTLNPEKAARWMDRHAEAMASFPELAARFRNAAAMRETLDATMARAQAEHTAFVKSAASKFLGDADPVATVGRILSSDAGEATMRQLAEMTANHPAAREGLQAAVVEHILGALRTNAIDDSIAERAFKIDAFQKFLRKALPALKPIFSPEEITSMRNVALDLQRSQRSYAATKLPGGSNTAQDLAGAERHGEKKPSVLGLLVGAEAAGEAVKHVAGPLGRVAGMMGVLVLKAMRGAGLQTVDELTTQAMLHPELARALLAKVPPAAFVPAVAQNAARQIMALTGVAGVRAGMGN